MDSQAKNLDLEAAVTELENTAQQQLRGLASQSEAAIEAAQDKLSHAYRMVQMYQQFVKVNLSHAYRMVQMYQQFVKVNLSHAYRMVQMYQQFVKVTF